MPGVRRVPPGRAGRIWVQHRLQTARRGADLLDRTLRILARQESRLRRLADQTRADWEQCSRHAEQWLLQAALLGGQRALHLATATEAAEVAVTWATTIGIRYPAEATCRLPARAGDIGPEGAALTLAAAAHGRALQAAVKHAAADAVLRRVSHQAALTRRRLRAIKHRWIPQLERTFADLELALEQREHEDGVRLRWTTGRRHDTEGGRP